MKRGKFFVLVGPSASGKSTIVEELLKDQTLNLQRVVSATTRPPREGEVEGVDHYFVSREKFNEMLNHSELLESALVHGREYYGVPKKEVLERLEKGENLIRDVDIQGVAQLQEVLPEIVTIFIKPADLSVLRKRLQENRDADDKEILDRLKSVEREMAMEQYANYSVMNKQGELKQAVDMAKEIIETEVKKES